jgi:hypothetical protein
VTIGFRRLLGALLLIGLATAWQPRAADAGTLTLVGQGMRQVMLEVPRAVTLNDATAALGAGATFAGYWVAEPEGASSGGSLHFPELQTSRNPGNVPPIAVHRLGPGTHRLFFLSDGEAAVRVPVDGLPDRTIRLTEAARASVALKTLTADPGLPLHVSARFPFEHRSSDDVTVGIVELESLPYTVHTRQVCVVDGEQPDCPADSTTIGAAPCPCYTGSRFFPERISPGARTAVTSLVTSDVAGRNFGVFISVGVRDQRR